MATLKKVTPNPVLSAKTQVAPGAGMAAIFGALADTMGVMADYMAPGAMQEMEQRGAEEGYNAAQGGQTYIGRSGLTGDIGKFGDAIASIESQGSGDYQAMGPVTKSGDRAYGRYQVMGSNVGDWTEKYVGRRMTPQEFLADSSAQDKVFEGEFGSYITRFGSAQEAASVWFTGQPIANGGGRSDGYITGNDYVDKFNSYLSANPGGSGGSYSATVDFELEGKSRPNKPNQATIDMLGMAADATFGEGSRVVIYSGKEHEGEQAGAPGRHPSGSAADVRVYDANGNLVKLDDPRAVTFAQNARRFGAQSIGAGSEYMGDAFHIDMFGPDQRGEGQGSYWGSWAQANAGAIFGIPVGNAPQTGTVVTTKDGRTQPKLYSPYSGPLLRAHNAAAEMAYNAEILNQSEVAFQAMRNNFPLDPAGFGQAAKAYVDDIVGQAPAAFKAGLRESLNGTIARNQASIMGAQQADTRQRANNASSALTERLSTQYAEALAAGDTEGAASLRGELEQVLRARENIPGASWTREQSNTALWKAERAADDIVQRNRTDQNKEWKSSLDTIMKAAKNGQTAGDESLLQNPDVWTNLPSEAAEAQAYVTLRDNFPEFFQMPPDVAMQMAQAVKDTPVQEGWEVDVAKAAVDVAKANKLAWEEDPIKRATEVLDTKPTPMPNYVPGEEQAFIEWLKGRQEYGYGLRDNGFTDKPIFLSDLETKALSELLAKGADPTLRATVAGVLVAGLGNDALGVMDALKVDNVTRYAGKMMAIGGNEKTAMMAMQGQAMIAEGLVDLPTSKTFKAGMSATMANAFAGIPNGIQAQGEILDYAQAIYAAQAQGVAPDSVDAEALMEQSIQAALGQDTNARGVKTGGIQSTMGFDTLLPVGVSSDQVSAAFAKATGKGYLPHEGGGFFTGLANLGAALMGDTGGFDEAIWSAATAHNGPVSTGATTKAGRPVWYSDGDFYSERSATAQMEDGRWVNFPTVVAGGRIVTEDQAYELAKRAGWKDPITGAELSTFDTMDEAVAAAKARSDGLMDEMPPIPSMVPMFNGKPLDPDIFGGSSVRLVATGGPYYRMEIVTGSGPLDVADANGNVMMIDLEAMIEAAQ